MLVQKTRDSLGLYFLVQVCLWFYIGAVYAYYLEPDGLAIQKSI